MFNPVYGNQEIDMFVSVVSAQPKQTTTQLATDLGSESCNDFAGSYKFNLQEQFALSWVNLVMMLGLVRNIALKIVYQ